MNTPDPPMRFNCIGAMFCDVIPTSRIAGNDGYQGSIANRAFISGTIGSMFSLFSFCAFMSPLKSFGPARGLTNPGQHDAAAEIEDGKIRRHAATGSNLGDLAVANHQHAVGNRGRGSR